jgi:hypothetical protein
MVDEDEDYRQDQLQYCLYAVAFTLVIFGVLYSLKLGPAIWLFAASISLTGIPVWLMLKGKPQFRSSVALLWMFHACFNMSTWEVLSRWVDKPPVNWNNAAIGHGILSIILNIGLLIRATIVARRRRELFDYFALAALSLCALLLAIGFLFF